VAVKVVMGQRLLKANAAVAQENRARFAAAGTLVVNLISSPGAGKTTLLEQTLVRLGGRFRISVIEGDIYTTRDAERIAGKGTAVVQVNTAGICHLDASMVARACEELGAAYDILFIENVGNLVCPAEFDLGEDVKVALLSVAEGGDKPAKYPFVFRSAGAVVITKADLLPFTDFDLAGVTGEIRALNPEVKVFILSARTGEGVEEWCRWVEEMFLRKRAAGSGAGSE